MKKIVFLTRDTWYSKIMIDYLRTNFENVDIYNTKVSKLNKNYDYLLSIGYQYIIPRKVINKIKIKSINIHPGSTINPGAGCYSYPIYLKQKYSGVTCHEISAIPDTGKVIIEKKFRIYENDNFESVKNRAIINLLQVFYEIIDLIISGKTLPTSKNQWKRKPRLQSEYINDLLTIYPNIDPQSTVDLKIKSSNPGYPGPYIKVNGKKYTIRDKFNTKFNFGK